MDDAISRQAVLKLLSTMPPEETTTKALFIQSVKQMDAPDNLVKDSQGLAKDLVNDCISRQAAIEAIEKHIRTAEEPYQLTDADKVMNHAFEIAASCVYNLSAAEPSAQPKSYREGYQAGYKAAQSERKRGRWIYGEDETGRDGWFCSECGHFKKWDYSADIKSAELNLPNYCEDCGADMREDEQE